MGGVLDVKAWLIKPSADLGSADLRSAEYTQETLWPTGFDPKAAGAVLIQ